MLAGPEEGGPQRLGSTFWVLSGRSARGGSWATPAASPRREPRAAAQERRPPPPGLQPLLSEVLPRRGRGCHLSGPALAGCSLGLPKPRLPPHTHLPRKPLAQQPTPTHAVRSLADPLLPSKPCAPQGVAACVRVGAPGPPKTGPMAPRPCSGRAWCLAQRRGNHLGAHGPFHSRVQVTPRGPTPARPPLPGDPGHPRASAPQGPAEGPRWPLVTELSQRPRTRREARRARAPHSLGHGQQHVGVVLTLLQGVNALGLPLGPGLEEDGFRPQHAWNSDTEAPPSDPGLGPDAHPSTHSCRRGVLPVPLPARTPQPQGHRRGSLWAGSGGR